MQDYLDLIETEGLLHKVEEETSKLGSATKLSKSLSSAQAKQAPKKLVTLAKLPEENKDGWAQLEKNMNSESVMKKEDESAQGDQDQFKDEV